MHQKAAHEQLAEHDLTIMKSFTRFFNVSKRRNLNKYLSNFDMLLTDVNLPSPNDKQKKENGATGFVIAFKALEAGIKFIGIITDSDHHQDTYSKALDLWLNQGPFSVGDVRIYLENDYDAVTKWGGPKDWKNMVTRLIESV